MSEVEIKQMQKKIEAGIQLARKRLIEKTKKEDGTLVVIRDGMVLRFLHPALFAVEFLPSLQIRSPTRISYPIKSSRHPYTIRSHEPWPYHHHQNTLYRQISQQNKPSA